MEEANGNQGNTATGERTRDILQGKLSPRVEDVEREREREMVADVDMDRVEI